MAIPGLARLQGRCRWVLHVWMFQGGKITSKFSDLYFLYKYLYLLNLGHY